MTAALDRIGTALTARPATAFFDALTAADEHIARVERLAEDASFAPSVTTFATCVCGSTFTAREDQIEATYDEKRAAVERLADMLGRAPLNVDMERLVTGVLDAINHERASQAWEDQQDWNLGHELCGEQL